MSIGGGEEDSSTVLDLIIRSGETAEMGVNDLEDIPRTESDYRPVKMKLGWNGNAPTMENKAKGADSREQGYPFEGEMEKDADKGDSRYLFRWNKDKIEEYGEQWIKEWKGLEGETN